MTNTARYKFFIVNFVLMMVLANAAFAQVYTRNSFPTFSGGTIFCNGNDIRVECRDSGDGNNHRCSPIGTNGCQAFEGKDNFGSPGCLIVCQTVPQPVQRCGDGTVEGQCSQNVPLFCQNGILVNRASFCGCPSSLVISGDNCVAPVQRCSDNTPSGFCSSTLPLFCQSGSLIQRASICGCPAAQTISGDTCIALAVPVTPPAPPVPLPSGITGVSGGNLRITDIDAEIDGRKSSNIRDNGKISKEAKPGSDVEFKITVKNEFNQSQAIDIENIRVVVIIEGVDNGNDIDAESSEFDLSAQDDKTVTLKFKLPLNVDEDTYNVLIEAEGDDENGDEQRDEASIDLEIEKETHDLRLLSLSLNPLSIDCNRIITILYKLINVGKEDESKSSLEIKNDELGLKFIEEGIAVQAEKGSNIMTRSVKFEIGNDAKSGSYSLASSIFTDEGMASDSRLSELKIEDCRDESGVVLITPREQAARLIRSQSAFLPFYVFLGGIDGKLLVWESAIILFVVLLLFIAIALFLSAL